MRRATAELLSRLLDSYEGSKAYGPTGSWRRDVIVRLDGDEFPDAFAPDGRALLEDLREAAICLEREGAARLERATGLAGNAPMKIRMGAAELEVAYRLATAEGFAPLASVVAKVSQRADLVADRPTTLWMRTYLESVRVELSRGAFRSLGIGRLRFKREWAEIADGLLAATAVAPGVDAWERVLSERIFRDSKRLAAVRIYAADALRRADPEWEGMEKVSAEDLLASYGIRRRPGVIRCAGGGLIELGARAVDMRDFVPTAYVPEAWTDAWVRGIVDHGVEVVTTVENEYPFFSYVEEHGGASALAASGELVIYTGGFPAPFLVNALRRLCEAAPALKLRHWGDADVGGLRIWWLLRRRLDRAITLFRTTADWIAGIDPSTARALTTAEVHMLRRLRDSLREAPDSDVLEAIALIEALLAAGIKLEQERAT